MIIIISSIIIIVEVAGVSRFHGKTREIMVLLLFSQSTKFR